MRELPSSNDRRPPFPSESVMERLNEVASRLVDRQFYQLGYPFDQNLNLTGFYEWLVSTGLNRLTLINVSDPYKTTWDMLNTDEFECKTLDFLAESFGFAKDAAGERSHWGFITSGGTDGNMHGVYFGRKALAAQSSHPPILYVSSEAHYSVQKLGDVQNIETRVIRSHPMGAMDVDDLRNQLDPSRPALVVLAVGGTFKGAIDDQRAVAAVLDEVKPVAVYKHLDVALFGGYLPWLDDPQAREVVNASVMKFDSLAVSGHKFYALNEPAGAFLCRKEVLASLHAMQVPYLNGAIPTISCSRSGFDALKFYWRIAVTGEEGFRSEARHILEMTDLLVTELRHRGVEPLVNRWSNTICFPRPADNVVHEYSMACTVCPHFGPLSHVVVMQFFTPKLIARLADRIALTR